MIRVYRAQRVVMTESAGVWRELAAKIESAELAEPSMWRVPWVWSEPRSTRAPSNRSESLAI